jgi:NADP-dependent 3-hydroxy acid dehydrogenase YdfG
MDLKGKIALVTGASSGIGEATARALANAGVLVGLAARRTSELKRIGKDIEATGGKVLILPSDLRDQTQIHAIIAETVNTLGGIDILVNNAGVGYWDAIADVEIDNWRNELEINLLGAMVTTRLAISVMLKQRSGHIVTVSSLAGRSPGPGWPGYSTSKAGLNSFTNSILYDQNLREHGIRVTLIEPGAVDTPMQADEERGTGKYLDPEDVADTIIYAVSRPKHVCVSNIALLSYGKA